MTSGIMGRPTKYKEEYPEMLIKHMAAGNSFESFAAECDCSFDTLYEWVKVHSNFSEAKKIGMAKLLKFDESIAKAGSTGQLTRLAKTSRITDESGNIRDEKEYVSATFAQTYHIFLMKNRYSKYYRDKIQIESSVISDPVKTAEAIKSIMDDPEMSEVARKIAEKLAE
jgi:hypothetical protein